MVAARILAFLGGFVLVLLPLRSAVRTFVLPRGVNDSLTRMVVLSVMRLFLLVASPKRTFAFRDRVMALFAPVALLCLPVVWVVVVTCGYVGMFWAAEAGDAAQSFTLSASSLVTLGFATPRGVPQVTLAFSEATIGVLMLALLVAYLPTIYSAFSKRELAVTLLEVRAGSPPSAVETITRFHVLGRLDGLVPLWQQWESWFAELEETHTSLAILGFFRSSQPDHSWVTASGAVLDAASMMCSVVDAPREAQAQLTIRAGYLALRRIGTLFGIGTMDDPAWSASISITREEFDLALASLRENGVPLLVDVDQGWRDFVGWRVNYDAVLLELAALTIAPYAPWSSDRARMPMPAPGDHA
jgi:hypothetical protein